ncbi:hypothetical protein MSPP1_002990 [Malassezia sp. CBS 17886]|nr:hypothetical protein MSPP1_002990 [Malassezia sp. CBS 17886]
MSDGNFSVAPSETLGVDRRKWSAEEDAHLTSAMMRFQHVQENRWTEIAANVPSRSAKACRKRWVNGLNERLKKGSWTKAEDDLLREGVTLLQHDWARIAEHVGQRSGDQCSKRWREVLDPAINKSVWTPEEDLLLKQLFEMHGSSWQIISRHFNNRRALQCRNRCCKLLGLHANPRGKNAGMDHCTQTQAAGSVNVSPALTATLPSHLHFPTSLPSSELSSPTMQGDLASPIGALLTELYDTNMHNKIENRNTDVTSTATPMFPMMQMPMVPLETTIPIPEQMPQVNGNMEPVSGRSYDVSVLPVPGFASSSMLHWSVY